MQLSFEWMPETQRLGHPFIARITVQCEYCHRSLVRRVTDVARNTSGRFFCDRQCLRAVGCRPRTGVEKPCADCGVTIYVVESARKPRRFCSKKCLNRFNGRHTVRRVCERCGTTYKISPSQQYLRAARFCSHRCLGDASIKRPLERQHNGRCARLSQYGYVMLWEPTHPHAMKGWILEHRLIVERRLGRLLHSNEHVHHRNGQKDDNRDANLVVLSHHEHSRLHNDARRYVRQQLAAEMKSHEQAFLKSLAVPQKVM